MSCYVMLCNVMQGHVMSCNKNTYLWPYYSHKRGLYLNRKEPAQNLRAGEQYHAHHAVPGARAARRRSFSRRNWHISAIVGIFWYANGRLQPAPTTGVKNSTAMSWYVPAISVDQDHHSMKPTSKASIKFWMGGSFAFVLKERDPHGSLSVNEPTLTIKK
jgi:hypothetical protein